MKDRPVRHGHRVPLAIKDEIPSTQAWARSAEGERRLGALLDTIAGPHVEVLHDRRIPHTRANVDHVVVAPSGVWVVDAKRYRGEVTMRDVGGWFRSDERLYVGRRDCSAMAARTSKQVAVIARMLDAFDDDLPVFPVLCFVESEWRLFSKPFDFAGVTVSSPSALVRLVQTRPSTTSTPVAEVAACLSAALPPAR